MRKKKLPSPLHWPEPCFTATAAACILRGPPCLLACPAHPARTQLTAACAHHAHHCQSAPPRRLRRRPRPVKLRRPPLLEVMRSTVVSALSASFRLLRVPSSVSVFSPAAVTQCIWSAWRSIARKLMARRTCFARRVATADARSAHMEGGPVCMTNTCGRYMSPGIKTCPCGKLSKTTNSARSPPTMRPNWAPVPIRSDTFAYSHGALAGSAQAALRRSPSMHSKSLRTQAGRATAAVANCLLDF